jgi:translation elongation factor EF-Ts
MIATIGENMTIRRAKVFTVEKGTVATYIALRREAGPRQDRRSRGA